VVVDGECDFAGAGRWDRGGVSEDLECVDAEFVGIGFEVGGGDDGESAVDVVAVDGAVVVLVVAGEDDEAFVTRRFECLEFLRVHALVWWGGGGGIGMP